MKSLDYVEFKSIVITYSMCQAKRWICQFSLQTFTTKNYWCTYNDRKSQHHSSTLSRSKGVVRRETKRSNIVALLQSAVSRPLTRVIELLSNNIAFTKLMLRIGIAPCDWLNFGSGYKWGSERHGDRGNESEFQGNLLKVFERFGLKVSQ